MQEAPSPNESRLQSPPLCIRITSTLPLDARPPVGHVLHLDVVVGGALVALVHDLLAVLHVRRPLPDRLV